MRDDALKVQDGANESDYDKAFMECACNRHGFRHPHGLLYRRLHSGAIEIHLD